MNNGAMRTCSHRPIILCFTLQKNIAKKNTVIASLELDEARLESALKKAETLSKNILLSHQFKLQKSYDAAALYGTLYHDPPPSFTRAARLAEFFWCHDTLNLVAFGHTRQLECTSFDALGQQLTAWTDDCSDATSAAAIRVVGGLAFDPLNPPEDPLYWTHYGPGKFWIPTLMIHGASLHNDATLTVNYDLDPQFSLEHHRQHLQNLLNQAQDWLIGSLTHDVSRETPQHNHVELVEPQREQWGELIDHSAKHLKAENALNKVVHARQIHLNFEQKQRPAPILKNLQENYPTCTTFLIRPPSPAPFPADMPLPQRHIGASPERLVTCRNNALYIDALAGSAPPTTSDEDFLKSEKDQQEHQIVIDSILAKLAPFATLTQGETKVDKLKNVKHLRTKITGTPKPTTSLCQLAQTLHPTPAVCGQPHLLARDYLREYEEGIFLQRGWYSGVVGWIDLAQQSTDLNVSLRCGLMSDKQVRLFVGAGIMPDSTAELELEETLNKANALIHTIIPPTQDAP